MSLESLLARTMRVGTCLIWQGATYRGYGRVKINGQQVRVHRAVYELAVGAIPDGLTLDHLCRNRACVNVEHLEPCTRGENTRRAHKGRSRPLQPTCKRGHPFDEENTYICRKGKRRCRTCSRERRRGLPVKHASECTPRPEPRRTHCPHGHIREGIDHRGYPYCLICRRARDRQRPRRPSRSERKSA